MVVKLAFGLDLVLFDLILLLEQLEQVFLFELEILKVVVDGEARFG